MAAFYSLCTEIKTLYLAPCLALFLSFGSLAKDVRAQFSQNESSNLQVRPS